jgi:hypothetical protein
MDMQREWGDEQFIQNLVGKSEGKMTLWRELRVMGRIVLQQILRKIVLNV